MVIANYADGEETKASNDTRVCVFILHAGGVLLITSLGLVNDANATTPP